jgi:subtilase family serine protease
MRHISIPLLILFTLSLANSAQAQQGPQVLHNHVRPVVANGQAVPVGLLPTTQRLNLAIQLPLRNESDLDDLLSRLYDPQSPNYRKFLSVAQFTENFGPTKEDYQAVVDFAKANGFRVTTTPNRMVVDINGSVAQIEAAFHVVMMVYQHPTEKRTFYSPDREPSLDLSVPIAHIAGLNDFSIPRPKLKKAPVGHAIEKVGSGPGGQYLAGDMRAAYYGSGPLNGGRAYNGSPTDFGQAVGLLEFAGYDLADVYASFDGVSYTVPVVNVLLDGLDGLPCSGCEDTEEVLDIVQPIGMAPGMNSLWVFIGNSDVDIFNSMATNNCTGNSKHPQVCKQLSCSWGWYPEDSSSDDSIFKEFATQGQNLFVASGDAGAYTGSNKTDESFPAEDPYIVAVGGTDLTTSGPGGSWVSETAWSNSSGGPADDGFAIPSWQSGVNNSSNGASSTIRNIPDVAAEANWDNWTCFNGACEGGWGGTSFAAPRWAGFLALANQQAVIDSVSSLGFINPIIYPIGEGPSYDSVFHDITSGNNNNGVGQSYNAVTGYDLVTGWGSPNGPDLIYSLIGVNQAPTITSANHTTFTVGVAGSFQVTAAGFPTSMTFSESGALPSGVTLSTSGLLSGTPGPGTGGIYVITITASNGVTPNATQFFVLTVDQAPAITSANYTTFTIGVAGSFQVTATGFPAPTFTESGLLPGGVTLSSTGLLSGTPAPGTAGIYYITITASNGVTPNATQSFTLTVVKAPTTCTIYTTSPTFTNRQPISFTAFVKTTPGEVDAPSGTVKFVDSAQYLRILGTRPLISGTAAITSTLQAPPNTQWVKGLYSGDNSFLPCQTVSVREDYK